MHRRCFIRCDTGSVHWWVLQHLEKYLLPWQLGHWQMTPAQVCQYDMYGMPNLWWLPSNKAWMNIFVLWWNTNCPWSLTFRSASGNNTCKVTNEGVSLSLSPNYLSLHRPKSMLSLLRSLSLFLSFSLSLSLFLLSSLSLSLFLSPSFCINDLMLCSTWNLKERRINILSYLFPFLFLSLYISSSSLSPSSTTHAHTLSLSLSLSHSAFSLSLSCYLSLSVSLFLLLLA